MYFRIFQEIMSITYDNLEYLLNIMCGYEGTDKAHPHSPARECRMRLIHICKTAYLLSRGIARPTSQ